MPGGRFAVVAMGKLGGREMTAGSDLDLIFVYNVPPDVEASDGPKPLAVIVYYARLAQRFIAALTALTAAGGLYEVDMRLRPTGNKGPVAVSLASFTRYHAEESWTWERMALTRARVVHAPSAFAAQVEATIRATLTAGSDSAKVKADARDMRDKLAAQFPGKNRWDLKFAPGGLVDIEFVAQTLAALRRARPSRGPRRQHDRSPEETRNRRRAVVRARANADRRGSAGACSDAGPAHRPRRHARTRARHAGLKALLVHATGYGRFEELEARLARMQAEVRDVLNDTLR
ncbi:MAG: hypothetical protein WDM81_01810 [Rhizomicrobium sp.]